MADAQRRARTRVLDADVRFVIEDVAREGDIDPAALEAARIDLAVVQERDPLRLEEDV